MMNLEHLVPSERPFAWLGVLRPSEACAGVLAKLGAAAAPATRDRLQALQVGSWPHVSAFRGDPAARWGARPRSNTHQDGQRGWSVPFRGRCCSPRVQHCETRGKPGLERTK